MKKKINRQLIVASVLATVITMLFMTFVFYGLLKQQVRDDLEEYAKLLLYTEEYKEESLYTVAAEQTGIRVTWIGADGRVLGETEGNSAEMENHAERPEVKEAIRYGEGTAVRISETLQKSTYYYAVSLPDGTVLRLARDAGSIWGVMSHGIPALLAVLLIILVLCVLLARLFTRNLLRPLTELAENLDRPEAVPVYKELEPFVQTIRTQHENILRSARIRQDFTANVSHELKTPLTAISGYSELIETGIAQGEDIPRFAKEIHHNSNRLLALINDIIHLSEMDGSDVQVPMQSVELLSLAERTVEAMKVNAQKRQVTLTVSGEEAIIYANPDMIEELLWNLCDNAIRYNKENGCVTVSVTKAADKVCLAVTDTGIGIPKEHQERVFERFYRVDKSRSKQTGGTGLGLAIVKHIVAQHDASMELFSEEGRGTRISVLFPVRQGEK
ncbi:MAG: ATP-binding protein [Lachnospiraceae bacterium]